jgi:large subunit ribosomal protein L10
LGGFESVAVLSGRLTRRVVIVALALEEKKQIVSEVAAVAASAHSVVAAEYRGLSVSEMTDLRVKARAGGVYLRVVKNSLARRAFEGTDYECMNDGLVGPMVLAFSQEEPGAAARLVKDFAKEHANLKAKLVSIGGQLYDSSELERLASLPTKEQAISMLMSVMRAPLDKFARTLNEVPGKLVRTMAAVRDQKEAA